VIRLYCPRGHFIADVNIDDDGRIIPIGTHGLSWGYAEALGHSCVRARCLSGRCDYDGSVDYAKLRRDLAAPGITKYRFPV
jgi:hypothetical protein